ncbi:uncharacterized protein [Atheta coriaria]|uniref:uncharacterized protein n=1 Tax=Dalotia coriaria TaxID=877792 RepID=UPI0031F3EF1E
MKLHALGVCLLALITSNAALPQVTNGPSYTKLSAEQIKHLQSKGFGPTVPTPFRATQSLVNEHDEDEEEEDEDIAPAQSQARRPVYGDDYNLQNVIPVQVRPAQRPQPQPQPQIYRRPIQPVQQPQYVQHQHQPQQPVYSKSQSKDRSKVEEEIEEEPDRLSLLLPNSKFDCTGKNTGYYADEDLQCEVFHYCQDNAKHSWICPEGFTFHQVHLICMPPGADNICAKSSQFHFVNEYLYKPVNLEEHQRKPNISLKYSDRYYPENYYSHNSYEEDDEEEDEDDRQQYVQQQQYHHQRKPVRVGLQQTAQQHQVLTVVRPTANLRAASSEPTGQVFRSPEEVNISLQQRKPQYVTQRYRDELAGI